MLQWMGGVEGGEGLVWNSNEPGHWKPASTRFARQRTVLLGGSEEHHWEKKYSTYANI